MCGLAHYLEAEGIATVLIGLIPQHVRAMRPPRALVVPFDLGRPLGAPNDADLQREVLALALHLLDRNAPGPLVETFAGVVPALSGPEPEGFSCPVSFPAPSTGSILGDRLATEVRLLMPWFERSLAMRGHTTTGASELAIERVCNWLIEFLTDPAPEISPVDGSPLAQTFKLAVDDLKAFYLEAVTAQPNPGSAAEIDNWFWDETAAGELLTTLRDRLMESADVGVKAYARSTLVPRAQLARRSTRHD